MNSGFTYGYNDYQKAASGGNSNKDFPKVGFFKLKDDGDEALVRFNISSIDDLQFATVHSIKTGNRWMKVSCFNPLGLPGGSCPLCTAVDDSVIGKASKKVFVQMLVSYKENGNFSEAIPVIWERPGGFAKEIANKLSNYGDLREIQFKVIRNGKAGDQKTTYSIEYAFPAVFPDTIVSKDFSVFDNVDISRVSYWVKTADEVATFLATGSFPEVVKKSNNDNNGGAAPSAPAPAPVVEAYYNAAPVGAAAAPVYNPHPAAPTAPVYTATVPQPAPAPQPAPIPVPTPAVAPAPQPTRPAFTGSENVAPMSDRPQRTFEGFRF